MHKGLHVKFTSPLGATSLALLTHLSNRRANRDFRSRFNKYFFFDDYNPDQLVQIFDFFCQQSGFHLAANAQSKLHGVFSDLYAHRNENFGNAREARNIFERAITNQANRIVRFSVIDDRMLTEINADDIPAQPIQ